MDIKKLYNEFIDNTESNYLHNNSIDSKHKKILKESSEQIKKLSYKNFRNWDSQNDMGLKYPMTFFSKIFLGINSLIFFTQFFDILKKRINHFFEYSSMLDDIQVIKKMDCENILQDNPQNKTPGAINFPLVDNYSVTKRWLRYLYLFIQLKQNKILSNNLIWVDIGSYYGGLQGIVKKYFPNSIIFMVDFTHQLSRSYIYLKNLYPDSNHILPNQFNKINSINDIPRGSIIYVEVHQFDSLEKFNVDLVTNFFSLGEMKLNTFKKYMSSNLIKNSKFLYFVNRVFSSPFFDKTYDDNINIFDYSVDKNKCLHFDQFPIGNYQINNRKLHNRMFFRNNSSQYFEALIKQK